MPKIRFTRDYQVKGDGGAEYKQDQVITCSRATAEHFTRKDVAVLAVDKPVKAVEKTEKKFGAASAQAPASKKPTANELKPPVSQPSPSTTTTK